MAGSGSSRMRFGWKKFAVAAAVVIGFVWVLGPRERRESVIGSIKEKTPSEFLFLGLFVGNLDTDKTLTGIFFYT
jgi:hypothetical protein